jgi:hypothetical protein
LEATVRTTEERRISPRIDFFGLVLVRNRWHQIPCKACNLSETGILVSPTVSQRPGSQFRVTFALPDPDGWVDVEGRLVHRTEIQRRLSWGIEFLGVPERIRGQLRRFVSSNRTTKTDPPAKRVEQSGGRLAPAPVPAGPSDDADQPREEPTRRVHMSTMKQLAGNGDTRQTPRSKIDELLRSMTPKDKDRH